MLTIERLKELYPDVLDPMGYAEISDYSKLDELIGVSIWTHTDDDYQGETNTIFQSREDPNLYAHHSYSWGSCSGCDPLQAIDSWQALLEYSNEHIKVEWTTLAEIRAKCAKELQDRYCHNEEQLRKVIAFIDDDKLSGRKNER